MLRLYALCSRQLLAIVCVAEHVTEVEPGVYRSGMKRVQIARGLLLTRNLKHISRLVSRVRSAATVAVVDQNLLPETSSLNTRADCVIIHWADDVDVLSNYVP
jgi:hypothetical protein